MIEAVLLYIKIAALGALGMASTVATGLFPYGFGFFLEQLLLFVTSPLTVGYLGTFGTMFCLGFLLALTFWAVRSATITLYKIAKQNQKGEAYV